MQTHHREDLSLFAAHIVSYSPLMKDLKNWNLCEKAATATRMFSYTVVVFP